MKPHFRFDTDRDGIVDFMDCRPFNPRKQHVSKTMKRRLLNLDVVAPSEKEGEEEYIYHIATKEGRRKAPKATAEVLSVASKYPSIVSEMERLDKEKPIVWLHVGKENIVKGRRDLFGQASDTQYPSTIVTRSWLEEDVDKGRDTEEWEKRVVRKSVRDILADTTHHELRHIHQQRLAKKYPEIKRTTDVFKSKDEEDKYRYSISEIDARVYAREKVKEVPAGRGRIHRTKPVEMRGFRRLFDDYY